MPHRRERRPAAPAPSPAAPSTSRASSMPPSRQARKPERRTAVAARFRQPRPRTASAATQYRDGRCRRAARPVRRSRPHGARPARPRPSDSSGCLSSDSNGNRVAGPEDGLQHQRQQRGRRRVGERRAARIVGADAEAQQLGRDAARQVAVAGDERCRAGRAPRPHCLQRDGDRHRLVALAGRFEQRHVGEGLGDVAGLRNRRARVGPASVVSAGRSASPTSRGAQRQRPERDCRSPRHRRAARRSCR